MQTLAHERLGGDRRQRRPVGARLRLLAGAGLLMTLGGCGDPATAISQMAESTRTATEQMAEQSRVASARKELALTGGDDDLHHMPALRLVERYETRQGPDGYFLYDTQEHTVARFNGRPLVGLSLDQADRAGEALSYTPPKR